MKRVVVGVAGGSCAGKSSLVLQTLEALQVVGIQGTVVSLDDYYYDLDHMGPIERDWQNFDSPSAIDIEAACRTVSRLKHGWPATTPVYSTISHLRTGEKLLYPGDVIFVEGCFVLSVEAITTILDLSVYISAPNLLRLHRRIIRDTQRGADPSYVERYWNEFVIRGFLQFVRPHAHKATRQLSGYRSESRKQSNAQIVADLIKEYLDKELGA